MTVRKIADLQAVDALTGGLLDLANKADGLDGAAKDGMLWFTELVAAEADGGPLTPAERTLLPKVWSLYEATEPTATEAKVRGMESLVEDKTAAWKELSRDAAVAIASLAAPLAPVAQAVEAANDSDGDLSTISLEDVDAVVKTPGPVTAANLAQLGVLGDALAKTQDQGGDRVTFGVPAPGRQTEKLYSLGSMRIDLQSDIRFEEKIRVGRQWGTAIFETGIHPNRESKRFVVHVATGERVLLSMLPENRSIAVRDAGEELVLGGGNRLLTSARTVLVEVWKNGARTQIGSVKFPKIEVDETGEQIVGAATLTANGAPLHRALRDHGEIDNTSSSSRERLVWGNFAFDLAAPAPVTDPVALAHLEQLARPSITLNVGRYLLPVSADKSILLEIFRDNLAYATEIADGEEGERQCLEPAIVRTAVGGNAIVYQVGEAFEDDEEYGGGTIIRLDPATNLLTYNAEPWNSSAAPTEVKVDGRYRF